MNYQERLLFTMQYFHGSEASTRLDLRAMAFIWNFHPYGSRTKANAPKRCSPFEALNGFHYHEYWRHNACKRGKALLSTLLECLLC